MTFFNENNKPVVGKFYKSECGKKVHYGPILPFLWIDRFATEDHLHFFRSWQIIGKWDDTSEESQKQWKLWSEPNQKQYENDVHLFNQNIELVIGEFYETACGKKVEFGGIQSRCCGKHKNYQWMIDSCKTPFTTDLAGYPINSDICEKIIGKWKEPTVAEKYTLKEIIDMEFFNENNKPDFNTIYETEDGNKVMYIFTSVLGCDTRFYRDIDTGIVYANLSIKGKWEEPKKGIYCPHTGYPKVANYLSHQGLQFCNVCNFYVKPTVSEKETVVAESASTPNRANSPQLETPLFEWYGVQIVAKGILGKRCKEELIANATAPFKDLLVPIGGKKQRVEVLEYEYDGKTDEIRPKPDKDGWYTHDGKSWPVFGPEEMLWVELSDGREGYGSASAFSWCDVIKYRLHEDVTDINVGDKMVKIDWPVLPKGVWIEWSKEMLFPHAMVLLKVKYKNGLIMNGLIRDGFFDEEDIVAFMILK